MEAYIAQAFDTDSDGIHGAVNFLQISYHKRLQEIAPVKQELETLKTRRANTPRTTVMKKGAATFGGLITVLPLAQLPLDGYINAPNIAFSCLVGTVSAATWVSAVRKSLERHLRKLNQLEKNFETLDSAFQKFIDETGFFTIAKNATIANVAEFYSALCLAETSMAMGHETYDFVEGTHDTLEVFREQFEYVVANTDKSTMNSEQILQMCIDRRELIEPIRQLAKFFEILKTVDMQTLNAADSDEVVKLKLRNNEILGQIKDAGNELIQDIRITINLCDNLNNGTITPRKDIAPFTPEYISI